MTRARGNVPNFCTVCPTYPDFIDPLHYLESLATREKPVLETVAEEKQLQRSPILLC